MSDPAPAKKTPESPSAPKVPKSVIVRPYPKIVFLYPTMLFSLIAGFVMMSELGRSGNWPAAIALCFMGIFALNLLTIAFEFNRFSSIAIVLALFAVFLSLILINQQWPKLFEALGNFYEYLKPTANHHFYFMVFAIHLLIYIGVFIVSRFDYWEFRHNEILHKHGFLGDVKRYPAPGTQVTKEITDILEYMLLLSGRLVIFPPGADRPIVLDNVVRINAVEERVMKLLSSLSVTVDTHKHQPHPHE